MDGTTSGGVASDPPPSVLDRLLDRTTRCGVLEAALVAHVLLDPTVADGMRLRLSPRAALLLDAIGINPTAARASLLSHANMVLQFESLELHHGAVELADEAAALTVQDLALLGTFRHVIDLLASERHNIHRSRRLARAA